MWAVPAQSQNHYKSFTVSTYAIQGIVQGLMNGNPDPAQSWSALTCNLKPAVNKDGWVDRGGANPIDRYSEQLLDTVFARCPEMCCFHYSGMLGTIRPNAITNRTWADLPTSLNLDEFQKTLGLNGGNLTFADVAAYTLGQVDKVLVNVGKPVGIKTYTPYHDTGEEFLHDYLGMIGLPMNIFPHFPADADMVLLTEQAKSDPDIIHKIQAQLEAGKSVCVTSGFLRAMKGKGIEDICELETTGATVPVRRFTFAGGPGAPFRGGRGFVRRAGVPDPFEAPRDIPIPEIKYFNILNHDAWGDALGVSPGGTIYPIVLSCDYSKGKFYVLTIPNDPADLYVFPRPRFCRSSVSPWALPSPSVSTVPPRRSHYSVTTTTRLSCRTTYPRRRRSRSPLPAPRHKFTTCLPAKTSHPHRQSVATLAGVAADLAVVARPPAAYILHIHRATALVYGLFCQISLRVL